jgi:glycosyltransferase involved in cell wall biosynthesis
VPREAQVRVALLATHPIQYQIPWFRALAARRELALKVFFGMVPDAAQQGVGFGVEFQWDVPLLEGYESEILENVAKRPSLGTFAGCDTPQVVRRLRDWRPDVAILTGWQSKMLVQAWWACVRLGKPRIVRGDSNDMRNRAFWKRVLFRLGLRGFDQFLAVGKANRAFYRNAGIPDARIHACPHFVDNARFSATADALRERRDALRHDWSIPKHAVCFLYCGKLIAKKRPIDLLHALQRATAAGTPAHLLVVGEGELMAQARALVERERLPVTFAGFLNQTQIVGAYVAADCLVLPSDSGETWGLVVNEAMACGIPAVVSDVVGCGPDLIREAVTGATFRGGDVDALAWRLVDFARNSLRLRTMGEAAQRHVLSSYSVERAVEGTLAAIEAAARQT